jgi:hypothetical protein
MAAATVLLEHLLEYYPASMIPKFRAELESGNRRFARAVVSCGNLGNSRTRARRELSIPNAIQEPGAAAKTQLLVEGKISNRTFEEWNRETGGKRLPERVKRKAKASRKKR